MKKVLKPEEKSMEKIVALCKNRGFIFPGSDIYGGLANTWDYGPLGARLKNNVKDTWRKRFIQERKNSYEVDADILMHPRVWEASGHVASFSDPLLDCKECKMRHRADNLIDDFDPNAHADGMTKEEMFQYIKDHHIPCPNCGKHNFTDIREFNLMFQTFRGVTNNNKSVIYLRPENAQGEYVNFLNVQRTMRAKLPFSIGQIGKAFRNEITPGNFIFRTREFEQMELEFFTRPGEDLKWYEYYKAYCLQFLEDLGISREHLRLREHSKEELAHYSNGTSDIEYNFGAPIGWGELWGIADRTDYDLKAHMNTSKQSLEYFDQESGEKFVPYCIEPSVGVERMMLALMYEAYEEQQLEKDTRIVLHLHPYLAPIKACVLPLSKKLSEEAMEVYRRLSKFANCEYDEAGSIGKRYRRQDAIGTPFCVTVDFETQQDRCVTIRHRDSMEQVRIPLDQLEEYITSRIGF